MTLVSDLIRDAYRESNLIAISADPTDDEKDEGLRLLQRLVSSAYGNEAGEQLDPFPIGNNHISRPSGYPWYGQAPDWNDWFIPANSRLVLNLTSPQTLYLSPNPDDGARFAVQDKSGNLSTNPLTINANGRTIEDGFTITYNTDNEDKEYIFRQDLGNWQLVSPLALTDEFPYPEEFDDFFAIGLAIRLNPRHAQEIDQQSINAYNRSARQFKARYRQHVTMWSELALIRLPGSRRRYYDNTRFGNGQFNTGWAFPWGAPY